MKPASCIILFVLIYTCTYAQIDNSYQVHGDYLNIYGNSGNELSVNGHSNLTGSPMLNSNWGTGSVMFKNGKQASNVEMQFNLQNNTLYFRSNSSVYMFAEKVIAFKISYSEDGKKKEAIFKNGYPDRAGNATDFFYEVINNGPNIHFIKRIHSEINQHYVYGAAAQENYEVSEEPYLYIVKDNQLIKISETVKSVSNALSDYEEQIKKIITDNNYKLNNDKEINQLVTNLNYVK